MDIQEVLIREDGPDDEFKAILFCLLQDCQCFIYMVDITQPNSFEAIKKLHSCIDKSLYPNLSIILMSNKVDLEGQRKVSGFEIQSFLDSNNYIVPFDVSLKTGQNFKQLLDEVYKCINDPTKKVSINLVSECSSQSKDIKTTGVLKAVLLGDSKVGKSAFLSRYFKNQFHETFLSTIGISDDNKIIKVGEDILKLTVWDTAGQERFRSLPKKYYHKADAILLLFDVTDQTTFDNVSTWIEDIKKTAEANLTIYLIGNKVDLIDKRVISRKDAVEKAKLFNMKYFEVSCKLNLSISEVVSNLILDAYSKLNNMTDAFTLMNANKARQKKKCC